MYSDKSLQFEIWQCAKWDQICTSASVPWYCQDSRNERITISTEEAQLPKTPVRLVLFSWSVALNLRSQPLVRTFVTQKINIRGSKFILVRFFWNTLSKIIIKKTLNSLEKKIILYCVQAAWAAVGITLKAHEPKKKNMGKKKVENHWSGLDHLFSCVAS